MLRQATQDVHVSRLDITLLDRVWLHDPPMHELPQQQRQGGGGRFGRRRVVNAAENSLLVRGLG